MLEYPLRKMVPILNKGDVEFIQQSFYWAMDRLCNLPPSRWSPKEEEGLQMKFAKIRETQKQQDAIVEKLRKLVQDTK